MAKKYRNLGQTGLPIYAGNVYDEDLRELQGTQWIKTVRAMQNDGVIGAFLFAVEMLSRQVTWQIKPFSEETEDKKRAEFISDCLFNDLNMSWQDTLSEILSMIPFGYSYLEECYKPRTGERKERALSSRYTDGKIGWRKFSLRSQESLYEWKFDEEYNELLGMVQQPEPTFSQLFIPIEKALHFRTSSNKENPEGKSILRGVYRLWYFRRNIENIEGIGIERDLAGLPVFYVPPELFNENASPDQKNLLSTLTKMVGEIKRDENEGLVIPIAYDNNNNPLYKFELLSAGGKREFDTSKTIDRIDQRILMRVMADFLLLGSKETGSYALSTDKSTLFSSALGTWLDVICEVMNRTAIPRLEKLNGLDTARSPQLTRGAVEKISLAELGEFISKLSGVQVSFEESEIAWLKQQINMPIEQNKTKQAKKEEKEEKEDEK